ncbi:C40 family peptidase [Iodobacter ciconiae]|uniref:Peptidoglycan endopeptidase n=1 Tax=Iodobacter ciconiae TaxID=2496266 RepID=A0A3S8ZSV6_9NEIS|nr:C40 family peptidase [Iodobacter ciconiae]AZN36501.1 peptidoglycan endopeptidase [Iodobacter ciconiae]
MKWIRLISTLFVGACAVSAYADELPTIEVEPAVEQAAPAATITPRPRKAKPEAKPDYAPAQDVLLQAMSLIGVKYKWGGATPEAGLDCSGFVRYVFQNSMNIALPHNALSMAQSGTSISKDELKPGDLVFFNTLGRTFSHVGIYMGDNRFIHSPRAGKSVEITNFNQNYWTSRFNGARRYDGTGGAPVNMTALLASVPKNAATGTPKNSTAASSKPVCKTVKRKGKKQKVCEAPKVARESTGSRAKTSKATNSKKSSETSAKVTKTTKAKSTSSKSSKTTTKTKQSSAVKKKQSTSKKH